MNPPSLLYFNPPKTTPLSPELFEDLQLTQLMPSCPFAPVLHPLDEEELPIRQSFFRSLESPSFVAHLKQLRASVKRLAALHEAYDSASCEAESQVIFASLTDEMLCFAHLAAKDPDAEGSESDLLRTRFHRFFADFVASEDIRALIKDIGALKEPFATISACAISFHGKDVKVELPGKESYLDRIKACSESLGLNELNLREMHPRSLSPALIEGLKSLFPDAFAAFAAFAEHHKRHFYPELLAYEAPLSFYLEMSAMLDRVRAQHIPLVYPLPTSERMIHISEAYDISLLAKNETHIVPNDIDFDPLSPFFYLTGANGGGKTTYLRTVGIACTLLILGAPMAASSANTCIPSGIFTHFPHDERFDGSGRFVEEHRRVEKILEQADDRALILLNETYSTTNEENAVRMTVKLAEEVFSRGNFGLYITHQHALGKTEIPYLNVLVDRDDNNRRTFKIVRQKNSGGSFAEDILKKYGLTLSDLRRRFGGEA